jgi:hypothetical protein
MWRRERRLCQASEIAYELAMNEHPRQLEVRAFALEWCGRPSAAAVDLAFALRLEARLLRARFEYFDGPWH